MAPVLHQSTSSCCTSIFFRLPFPIALIIIEQTLSELRSLTSLRPLAASVFYLRDPWHLTDFLRLANEHEQSSVLSSQAHIGS